MFCKQSERWHYLINTVGFQKWTVTICIGVKRIQYKQKQIVEPKQIWITLDDFTFSSVFSLNWIYWSTKPQRYDTSLNVKKTRVSSVVKSRVSNLSPWQFINDVLFSKVETKWYTELPSLCHGQSMKSFPPKTLTVILQQRTPNSKLHTRSTEEVK